MKILVLFPLIAQFNIFGSFSLQKKKRYPIALKLCILIPYTKRKRNNPLWNIYALTIIRTAEMNRGAFTGRRCLGTLWYINNCKCASVAAYVCTKVYFFLSALALANPYHLCAISLFQFPFYCIHVFCMLRLWSFCGGLKNFFHFQ